MSIRWRYAALFVLALATAAFGALAAAALYFTLDNLEGHELGWRLAGLVTYAMSGVLTLFCVVAMDTAAREG